MPVTTIHSAGDYPLSNSSRRRRRLLMSALSRAAAGAEDDLDVPASVNEAAEYAEELTADHLSVWPVTPSRPEPATASGPRRGLHQLWTSAGPLGWLLAGESFGALPDGPSLCDRVTTALRLRRPSDLVMNGSTQDGTISAARAMLPRWLRHRPDLLLLFCGPADAREGMSGLARFEADLTTIISECARHSVVLMLTTSPLPLHPEPDPRQVEPLVYAEALRSLSAEYDVPLIDLQAEWEHYAIPPGLTGSWLNDRGDRPSAIGLMRLADQLVQGIEEWRKVCEGASAIEAPILPGRRMGHVD